VCGPAPLPIPSAPVAAVYGTTPDSVTVKWTASPDQNGGLQSVQRYLIYRQPVGGASWGDPAADIAASAATSYEWQESDYAAMHGSWHYAVLAQDCTPTNSTITTSNAVTLP
jgi:hypothetical protein